MPHYAEMETLPSGIQRRSSIKVHVSYLDTFHCILALDSYSFLSKACLPGAYFWHCTYSCSREPKGWSLMFLLDKIDSLTGSF